MDFPADGSYTGLGAIHRLMKTLAARQEERFRFYDVDWEFYDALLARLADRRVFVTYDRGSLEVRSPSARHENFASLLARLIETLTEELGIAIMSGRTVTMRRPDIERGLEPDACYWIRNEARVRGMDEIDLTRDPPPDLAVEVEVSARLLDREGIYAAIGVPELWRFDGTRLRVLRLGRDGRYRASRRSPSLPMAPLDQIERFLGMRGTTDDNSIVRGFRDWVREHLRNIRPD